ncbi:MAG: type II secretion system major pseudopilin GspG [Desulfobacteraceae bacterium]|jgi:general secretion pathway protein G
MNNRMIENNKGFTLIELLVVILILGLLAGIVGPRLFGHTDSAKQTKARVQIENLSSALRMYKIDAGRYPTTEQGLEALITQPQSGDVPKKWRKGGYLTKKVIPKDPWDNAYVYLCPGVHDDFDITSYGADGTSGGEDVNKDINSWELE